ncbi:hypothetical protein TNCT_640531 [Trichonephila clavata]|uniref:Uncharacterized protein n=1 Tax=Trichonephila clavata TaxID=2740835 RepID=A0A8X6F086_TRICU|nr:hypothetical protein TNCT_640531 [Trichonephila clavata]
MLCKSAILKIIVLSISRSIILRFINTQRHQLGNYKADLETLGPDLNSSEVVSHSEPGASSENARISFHTNGNNSILINTAIVYVRILKESGKLCVLF